MARYSLYQRDVILANGKKTKTWYVSFLLADGTRVRRSTGLHTKREAEDFVAGLEAEDERAYQDSLRKRTRFTEVAEPMFKDGADHLKRWEQKHRGLKDQTVDQHRRLLDLYLLPRWGTTWCDEISQAAFEDWLAGVESASRKAGLSGSSKNAIARTFLLVMEEARRLGSLEKVPAIEFYRRHSRRKDILLEDELNRLFPEDEGERVRIWRSWNPRRIQQEDPEIAVMFSALFALMVSAGLRPGEARAMHVDQLYREDGGLIIDRAFDDRKKLVDPKKSRFDDPHYRVTFVPERTWTLVERWLELREDPPEWPGLLFSYHGKPVGAYYLEDRLTYGLENAMIAVSGRNLTPHSCRYTYDTRMKPLLRPEVLREFIGHRSEAMTEHYDRMNLRPALETRLGQLAGNRGIVNRFWPEGNP